MATSWPTRWRRAGPLWLGVARALVGAFAHRRQGARGKRPEHFFRKKGKAPATACWNWFALQVSTRTLRCESSSKRPSWNSQDRAARTLAEDGRSFQVRGWRAPRSRWPGRESDEPRRGLNPRVACRDKWKRIEAIGRLKVFLADYRKAWRAFKAGARDVVLAAGRPAPARRPSLGRLSRAARLLEDGDAAVEPPDLGEPDPLPEGARPGVLVADREPQAGRSRPPAAPPPAPRSPRPRSPGGAAARGPPGAGRRGRCRARAGRARGRGSRAARPARPPGGGAPGAAGRPRPRRGAAAAASGAGGAPSASSK